MAKIDMHVHSRYSEHPSEWFLQRLGAKESYTDPEKVYLMAKKRGMDFVTLTDHNRIEGALLLRENHPEDTFLGVESTAYFPEDGCKIHILMYGFSEEQFQEIQKLRTNIYDLREYIRAEKIAYSVAHATFNVNRKLKKEHVEKLIVMFDVFEGINGGRNYQSNNTWMEILRQLKPEHIERLRNRYGLEAMSPSSWIKSFTAGSDDHGGLFAGKTYTLADAANTGEVLRCIRNKDTSAMGRHNDYMSLAFTVYKVAYDFSKSKNNGGARSLPAMITETIFDSSPGLKNKLKLQKLKSAVSKNNNRIVELFVELMEEMQKINPLEVDERLGLVYDTTSEIADEFFKNILASLQNDLSTGDVVNLIRHLSSLIPGMFLSVPFFSSMKHMFQSREMNRQVRESLGLPDPETRRKILWFTDTINGVNGISDTLKKIGWDSFLSGDRIRLVTTAARGEVHTALPPNVLYLPTFYSLSLPKEYDIRLCFPSVLKSLKIIHNEDPAEIYVSTPGPVGLMGLLCARLLNIKCTGFYHTDLGMEAERLAEDKAPIELIKNYTRWFYSEMDAVKVGAREYLDILEQRGLDRTKLSLFSGYVDAGRERQPRTVGDTEHPEEKSAAL